VVIMRCKKELPPAPPDLDSLPDFLFLREVSSILRLPYSTLCDRVRLGEIPATKLGHAYRVPKVWVLRAAGRLQETVTETAK
jgi:excisionase family DNA binding protein